MHVHGAWAPGVAILRRCAYCAECSVSNARARAAGEALALASTPKQITKKLTLDACVLELAGWVSAEFESCCPCCLPISHSPACRNHFHELLASPVLGLGPCRDDGWMG